MTSFLGRFPPVAKGSRPEAVLGCVCFNRQANRSDQGEGLSAYEVILRRHSRFPDQQHCRG